MANKIKALILPNVGVAYVVDAVNYQTSIPYEARKYAIKSCDRIVDVSRHKDGVEPMYLVDGTDSGERRIENVPAIVVYAKDGE